jgi:hypothetical protein
MKISSAYLALFISFILMSSVVVADGGAFMRPRPGFESDVWMPVTQNKQVSTITYENGKESMIISIDAEMESGELAWIFPVPARPEQVDINIVKDFPEFSGYEVKSKVGYEVNSGYPAFYLSQIYPAFVYGLASSTFTAGSLGSSVQVVAQDSAVEIHEHVEFGGLTSELVTAKDESDLYAYMQQKSINLPPESLSIMREYIGKDYSFVVSWVSDGLTYKQRTGGSALGVKAVFPTNDIFYPLRLTSIYGQARIPMTIYVSGHVSPNVFSEISHHTDVKYYRGDSDYTKISINSESSLFVDDLWMSKSAPIDILLADVILISPTAFLFVLFVAISVLSSIIAGLVFYRKKFSLKRFALLGVSNILTIIGFLIASGLLIQHKRRQVPEPVAPLLVLSVALVVCSLFFFANILVFLFSLVVIAVLIIIILTRVLDTRLLSFIIAFSIIFLIISFTIGSLILSAYPYTQRLSGISINVARNQLCNIAARNGCQQASTQYTIPQNGMNLQSICTEDYKLSPDDWMACLNEVCGLNC